MCAANLSARRPPAWGTRLSPSPSGNTAIKACAPRWKSTSAKQDQEIDCDGASRQAPSCTHARPGGRGDKWPGFWAENARWTVSRWMERSVEGEALQSSACGIAYVNPGTGCLERSANLNDPTASASARVLWSRSGQLLTVVQFSDSRLASRVRTYVPLCRGCTSGVRTFGLGPRKQTQFVGSLAP
jgi:hypothetical protein